MLGRSLFPSMVGRGYDVRLSVGTILGGASLDPIIPPSVLAIIIATLAQVSTGKPAGRGILPGMLLAGMFLVYVLILVWFKPGLAPDVAVDVADRNVKSSALLALLRMLPSSFIFFMVMGLVMFGIATPTEAAATGVLSVIILALNYWRLSWGNVDGVAAVRSNGVDASASRHVLRCDVQPVADVCRRTVRSGGDCRGPRLVGAEHGFLDARAALPPFHVSRPDRR